MQSILLDTSVWVSHFKQKKSRLEELFIKNRIVTHQLILGELLLGNIREYSETYRLLCSLAQTPSLSNDEVLQFISDRKLHGSGIGWVDTHLIMSAILSDSLFLTEDNTLMRLIQKKFAILSV